MAKVTDQLEDIRLGVQEFPFGDTNVKIRYLKTSSGIMLGAGLDVAKAMSGPAHVANAGATMSHKLKSMNINFHDLRSAINQVMCHILQRLASNIRDLASS
jgi:hypothetical protein